MGSLFNYLLVQNYMKTGELYFLPFFNIIFTIDNTIQLTDIDSYSPTNSLFTSFLLTDFFAVLGKGSFTKMIFEGLL